MKFTLFSHASLVYCVISMGVYNISFSSTVCLCRLTVILWLMNVLYHFRPNLWYLVQNPCFVGLSYSNRPVMSFPFCNSRLTYLRFSLYQGQGQLPKVWVFQPKRQICWHAGCCKGILFPRIHCHLLYTDCSTYWSQTEIMSWIALPQVPYYVNVDRDGC